MSKKSMLYLVVAVGAYYLYKKSQPAPTPAQAVAADMSQRAAAFAANPLSVFGL